MSRRKLLYVSDITNMGADTRKPDLKFIVCEQQRRRPVCAFTQSDQCFVFHLLESSVFGKSSLPGSALRIHVESLGKPHDVNKRLVNLISKDTNLVFSIYLATWNISIF